MSKFVLTKDNVFDYFERIPENNTHLKCKSCGSCISYFSYQSFILHLRSAKHSEYFKKTATKNLADKSDIYYNRQEFKCIVCKKNVLPENFDNHIHNLHLPEQVAHYEVNRTKKEHMTQISEFMVICELNKCNRDINLKLDPALKLHLRRKHSNILKNVQTGEMHGPSMVTNKKELLNNYTLHMPYFQAKCKFCDNFVEYYINIAKFRQHLIGHHPEVSRYEDVPRNKEPPWIHFMYYSDTNVRCYRCDYLYTEVMKEDWLRTHMDMYHQKDENSPYFNEHVNDWAWKYCDTIGDFQVQCKICSVEEELDIEVAKLNDHFANTHQNKPPSRKREYEIAGPSGSQSQEKKSKEQRSS
ncbi:uncharacterized protein [Linepithema humile]|uniref:uncharacterized protein n=1 Tax=Linepithema humile TaxID=83485 RepID=UPI00351E89E1